MQRIFLLRNLKISPFTSNLFKHGSCILISPYILRLLVMAEQTVALIPPLNISGELLDIAAYFIKNEERIKIMFLKNLLLTVYDIVTWMNLNVLQKSRLCKL